ncbi:MAG: S8 family serine peptidase [Acidimicrobiia bacterium]
MRRIFAAVAAAAAVWVPGFVGSAAATTPRAARPDPTASTPPADGAASPTGDFTGLERDAKAHGSVRVLVKLRPAASAPARVSAATSVARDAASTDATITRRFDDLGVVAMQATPDTLQRLRRSPLVESVGPDRVYRPILAHSVPTVEADQAAAVGYNGTGTTIAVVDSGVDAAHPFLNGRVVDEACFASGEVPDPSVGDCPNGRATQTGAGAGRYCDLRVEGCAHGTHVSGIAAGAGGPVAAPNGVAPHASIMAIRVFSYITEPTICGGVTNTPCIGASTEDIVAALQYVSAHSGGVAAVNLSLGGGSFASQAACDIDGAAMKAAIDALRAKGIATVVASGNDGTTNSLSSPACISSAISVGATGSGAPNSPGDQVAGYSDSAPFLSLLAPGGTCGLPCSPAAGTGITSSVPIDLNGDGVADAHGYEEDWGTSMATPHVAGAFAVLRQRFPGASVGELLARLQGTGVRVTDRRNGATFSRIRIKEAMDAATPGAPSGATATPGLRAATVSWIPPSSDGGASISSYTVAASDGTSVSVSGAATSATLTGLRGSTAYTFTVRATNAAGAGPASGPTGTIRTYGSAAAPTGVTAANTDGYWIVSTNGRIFNYGTAKAFGSAAGLTLRLPVVGASATVSGSGVWLVASDGGIFSFGDAKFFGSTGAIHLNQPIVAMAPTPTGNGYWLVASDGGIFAFGDATFFGSTGAIHLNQPIVGMAATPTGNGYQFVAADGGIFNFGDATFHGSAAGSSWFPLVALTR